MTKNSIERDFSSIDVESIFKPTLLRINSFEDRELYNSIILNNERISIQDTIYNQLKDLIKCRNPTLILSEIDYENYIQSHLKLTNIKDYGVWAYYPWNLTMLHILDEEEFFEVRTNRNRDKITCEEQRILKTKIIGIIGLSVGQSIALTIAMERTCGELRLADFDTLDLSNLNRVRAGLHSLGEKKTVIVAREISEIDPFINVKIFSDGLTYENMDTFFKEDGKIDLLVEVCDGIDIKILSRFKARQLKIPVIMDTNDRGMLDIERFDIEPQRSIMHGLIEDFIESENVIPLDFATRLELFKALVSFDSLSERMKLSIKQMGITLTSFPQLASSVVLGGAISTDASRRILLGQHNSSGRYYVDLDQLIN